MSTSDKKCLQTNYGAQRPERTEEKAAMMMRVAVIGAGAAGLCAARHVLARPTVFAPPVVFELIDRVGGTWCYEEQVGVYNSGRPVHSSVYRDLRTNLPKEVMMFPDFPFDPELSSFMSHQEVQKYLEKYCQSHNIGPHVRFNTTVEKVQPVSELQEGGAKVTAWRVTSSHVSGLQKTETFDTVFVCSGHYSDPHVPDIPGIHHFKGTVLHSHSYKFPEAFAGQSVLVLGAKASGLDISMELVNAGCQVTLSHRGPRLPFALPPGIKESSTMVCVRDDGSVRFQDGSVGVADVLIFCTGYNFKYPFLDSTELGVTIQQQLMSPLYRYMVPPAFPSLFFIGVCKLICPFPNFNCQVQFALAVLDGTVPLPSRAQMEEEVQQEERDKLGRGVERRHLMVIQQDQWDYCQMLASAAGFSPLPPVIRSLYEEVWRQRRVHPEGYRRQNYRLVSATQWETIKDKRTGSD